MTVIFSIKSPFRSPYELHRLEFGEAHPDFPTVAIVAGLHGNELNGIHALNLLASVLRLQKIKGKVLLYPIINTFGADECRKRWPFENQDINSIFPGDPQGTTAERIAYALYDSISEAHVCIDVHSGASHVREIPQVRTPLSGIELEYARDMALPVIWRRSGEHLQIKGFVGSCRARGQISFRITGGRGTTLDASHSTKMADGLSLMLAKRGIMRQRNQMEIIADVSNKEVHSYRSPLGGFFVPEIRVGEIIQTGRLLGYIQNPIGGARLDEIRSKTKGVVMSLRANPMIHAEELLVRIGEIPT